MTLMIGFNRRFDPNFAALQKRLADGAVGNVEMVTHHLARPGAAAGLATSSARAACSAT